MTDPQNNPENVQDQQPDPAAPPWGEDFDAAKAWNLIQGLRSDKAALSERAFGTPDEFAQAKSAMDAIKRLEDASRSDLERQQQETTRWQTETEKWRATAIQSQVQALAAGKFADPEDAIGAIGDASKYISADGAINTAAITTDLDQLLVRKPHWRANADTAPPTVRAPAPNPLQGMSGKPAGTDPAAEFGAILSGQLNAAT